MICGKNTTWDGKKMTAKATRVLLEKCTKPWEMKLYSTRVTWCLRQCQNAWTQRWNIYHFLFLKTLFFVYRSLKVVTCHSCVSQKGFAWMNLNYFLFIFICRLKIRPYSGSMMMELSMRKSMPSHYLQ